MYAAYDKLVIQDNRLQFEKYQDLITTFIPKSLAEN